MIDGYKIKNEYDKLPHGKAKESAIKKAITIADDADDYVFSFIFREDLMKEDEFHGDSLQSLLIFPEMLKIFDEHESEMAEKQWELIWHFKWILNDASDFYQVSKEKAYELFDEFRRRCERYGYSLRPYYQHLYQFENDIDKKSAKRAYQQFVISTRDSMSDCYACEMDTRVGYELENASLSRALETAYPILSGQAKCGEIPHITYKKIMNYFYEHDDLENAEVYRKKCYRLISKESSFLHVIGDMLKLYTLTDTSKGIKLFEKHLDWELKSKNMSMNMDFDIGAAALFDRIKAKKKTVTLHLPNDFELYREDNTYDTEVLADYYYKKAFDLCNKFDKRNGNDWNAAKLENTIARNSDIN